MIRKLFITLIGIGLLAGSAVAANPAQPFLPYYWVRGTVTRGDTGAVVSGRLVAFYKEFGTVATMATVMTDSDGKYQINVYDLFYYQNVPITLEAETYKVAVPRTDTSNLGTEESITLPAAQGYLDKNLVIIEGGGPMLPSEAPAGTVPLEIARNGVNIEVRWNDSLYPKPQIFAMTGTGSGEYTNTAIRWTKIAAEGAIVPGLSRTWGILDTSAGLLTHEAEVSGGHAEVYYKGVKAEIDTTVDPGIATLESAWAVGKLDMLVSREGLGYNYVSVPFNYRSNQIRDVLDTAYLDNGTLVFSQLNGFDFDIAEVNSSGVWVSAFEASKSTDIGSDFHVKPESSYMIKVPADRTFTVVGDVLRGTEGRALRIQGSDHVGGNLYTYFGNFYPTQFVLQDANVNDSAHLKLSPATGDRLFYPLNLSFDFNIAYYSGGRWRNEFDPAKTELSNITLKLPLGYMYKRNGTSFDWAR